jgi:SAM-dependent methyltransferase
VSFDVAAEAYDRFMGAWSRLLVPGMIELAGVRDGDRALDVGCGPGTLTVELARRLGAERVAAVDPSPAFAATARQRAPGVDVREAPADALPFGGATFDVAIAQLVVHFMPDPVAGLREMARVTRGGGVVAACVWDYAAGRGPLGPFWEAVLAIDPDARDESGLPGAHEGHLAELFGAAGLREVVETDLSVSREFGSFDDWWTPFEVGAGPARSYLRTLDDDGVAALRDRCRSMLPGGSFTLTARAWAARGVA